ncbi:hypothetical protein LRS74_22300 [Streptomyces sp. LX-29]|uniref:hypothetical protein n=1 Tax=Streptomyces sp. LX-29 TaxID=2900152 RepID=UPI00240D7683|nr:hypothetical protein [Streptomyces sp. LX-29]WFB09469.1 hypothetical protein LRS74_22300 [Streptomyces sp. LX-29]
MHVNTPHPWNPPHGPDIEAQPAGRWWDAVKVPSLIGQRALALLGGNSGPVIEDTYGAVWYWLVAPGVAGDWTIQRVLSLGAYVAVPPVERTYGPGPHWRVVPAREGRLTDAGRLHSALRTAHASVKVCLRCQRMTGRPVTVALVHGGNGGRTHYACPDCAPYFPPQSDPLADLPATQRSREERRT